MMYTFRWNTWNVEHIAEHGVSPDEAETAVLQRLPGYPKSAGAGKYLVVGRTFGGEFLQVAYIFDPPGVMYVIHARPLSEPEKRRARRRSR